MTGIGGEQGPQGEDARVDVGIGEARLGRDPAIKRGDRVGIGRVGGDPTAQGRANKIVGFVGQKRER